MKRLVGGLLVSLASWAPLHAQERDPAFERIRLELERPFSIVRGVDPAESTLPKTFGIFTFLPPARPGEMVRVSIPIGELVSRAFKGVAATNQRRQEAAARRRVAAAIKWFEEQQPSAKR